MERRIEKSVQDIELLSSAEEVIKNVEKNSHYPYLANIDAIFVLGGPGSYFSPLKDTEPEWAKWMDHDRIDSALNLLQEAERQNGDKPIFVYSGSRIECQNFLLAAKNGHLDLSTNRILAQDDYMNLKQGLRQAHLNTRDNIEGISQSLSPNYGRSLSSLKNIAIVSHVGHFTRIPFYLERFHERDKISDINVFPIGVPEREEALIPFRQSERKKLLRYASCGDLARTPAKLSYFWEKN